MSILNIQPQISSWIGDTK